MHPSDRNGSQGATIIRLIRPSFGQAAGIPDSPPHLLVRVRECLRARHYSPRTEKAYLGWMHRYLQFHGQRQPEDMAEAEIGAYLSSLAEANVSLSLIHI